jgi:hypothetical protein
MHLTQDTNIEIIGIVGVFAEIIFLVHTANLKKYKVVDVINFRYIKLGILLGY